MITKEGQYRDDIKKGRQARSLLDDPVLKEAIELAEKDFYRESVYGDTIDDREAARAKVLALAEIPHKLEEIKYRGEYAEAALKTVEADS